LCSQPPTGLLARVEVGQFYTFSALVQVQKNSKKIHRLKQARFCPERLISSEVLSLPAGVSE
jgi:hypothetical protein